MGSSEGPLACPRCARHYPVSERFCSDCEMPLVYVGQGEMKPVTGTHDKARKVKPQYTRGELVRIAGGRNLAEAELIQGILLEEGIPSMQRRTRGFDVPDFLAAGPRDILVPQSAAEDARSMLNDAEVAAGGDADGAGTSSLGTDVGPAPVKLLAWILIVLAIGSGLLGLVYALGA